MNEKLPIQSRLARAIASVEPAAKDAINPMFKSRYMTLDSILSVVKPALLEQRLALQQIPTYIAESQVVRVSTNIMDMDSADIMSCGFTDVPMVKLDAQAMGSATTYGRKYSVGAIFSLESDDDDGNAAAHTQPKIGKPNPIPGATSAHEEEETPEFMRGSYEEHRGPRLTPARPPEPKKSILAPKGTEATIKQFIVKTGQGDKGPWTRYDMTFSDGTKASTFDQELGELAGDAFRKDLRVAYDAQPNAKNPKFAATLQDVTPIYEAEDNIPM